MRAHKKTNFIRAQQAQLHANVAKLSKIKMHRQFRLFPLIAFTLCSSYSPFTCHTTRKRSTHTSFNLLKCCAWKEKCTPMHPSHTRGTPYLTAQRSTQHFFKPGTKPHTPVSKINNAKFTRCLISDISTPLLRSKISQMTSLKFRTSPPFSLSKRDFCEVCQYQI